MSQRNVQIQLSVNPIDNPARPFQTMGQAAKQAAEQQRRLNQERNRSLGAAGLAALSLNPVGVGFGMAGAALGAGAGNGMAAAFAALAVGADRAAKGIEVLNNSFLNNGQKMDKLASEWIPGASAFIALRQAVNGTAESLRQMEYAQRLALARQRGQGEHQRADLAAQAQETRFREQARAAGNLASKLSRTPPEGAIMSRGTVAEEIAFENAQRALSARYEKARAESGVRAAQGEMDASNARAAALRKEQDRFLNRRDQAMDALQKARRSANLSFDPFSAQTDKNQVEINRRAYEAELAIRDVDKNRVALEEELNRQKELGVNLSERQSAVRKAQIGIERAELESLQAKEQRSAGLAFKIGSMSPAERMRTRIGLQMAQQAGLENLPPSLKRAVEGFLPEYAQKEYEKTAGKSDLYKKAAELGGKDFIDEKGDFAALRKQIQEKAARVEVQVILDAEQMAQATARYLGPVIKELVEQIKVHNANEIAAIRRGQYQQNANR